MEKYIKVWEGELTVDDGGYYKIDGKLIDDLIHKSLIGEQVRLTLEILKKESKK